MILSDFIRNVCYALKGTDDDPPASGDDDWNYWTTTANRLKDEWVDDVSQDWQSLFKTTPPVEPGTVTTNGTSTLTGSGTNFTDYNVGDTVLVSGETVRTIATIVSDTSLTVTLAFSTSAATLTFYHSSIVAVGQQTYNMHRSFVNPSDSICVLRTDNNKDYYDLIKAQERPKTPGTIGKQMGYLTGNEADPPITLTLVADIVSASQTVGGTLTVPGFYRPADIDKTDDNAIIPVDNPQWLVMATAAEVAFNDITYEDKFADLQGKANEEYRKKLRKNNRATYGNVRQTPYKIHNRISGFR